VFITFVVAPVATRFPIVKPFEEDMIPSVSVTVPIVFIVGSRFMLPLRICNAPTSNLEFRDPLNLLPPPKVNVELEILFCTFTELLKMFIAMLLVKLPDILIILGVLIVRSPVRNSLPAKSIEVKPDPERSKLGVALEVIEPVKVKFPAIVRVWFA